jgi:hypothetical protein
LAPVAAALEIRLEIVPSLPAVEEARKEMDGLGAV